MIINNISLNIGMVAYDGCHKIYIPVSGQESLFIQSMEDKGWIFDEDFFRIDSVHDLQRMYMGSCSLRFITQIDCSGDEEKHTTIIPQSAFCDDDGFFDEDLAAIAFIA